MRVTVIGVQRTDLMNNVLIVLKLGNKSVFEFFVQIKVGALLSISSVFFSFVTQKNKFRVDVSAGRHDEVFYLIIEENASFQKAPRNEV